MLPQPGLSLKGRALRLLAAREQSRAELQRKLAPHAESAEQLSAVLDELERKDFISEKRVVESLVNRKQAKLGAARLKQELLGKGLSSEIVGEAVNQLKTTELARAKEVWRKKFASRADAAPPDAAARGKQMRFLAARGFSGDAIRRAVSGAEDELD
jgi:regulatory protein